MTDAPSNGFDSIAKHVEAHEAVDAELEAMKMAYMNQCREKREAQKRIVKMVKAEGFASDSFKAVIKHRRLARKIDAISAELENEDAVETYEQMLSALGGLADLPLGQAAMESSEPKRSRRAGTLDEIQRRSNVVALETGIKPLADQTVA